MREMTRDDALAIIRDAIEDEMEESEATFEGTPAECLSWLQTHFAIMRKIVEGAMSNAPEDEVGHFEEMLDVLDRSVYKVRVRPLKMVAKDRVRLEHMARVNRMETGLLLFDILRKTAENDGDDGQGAE